MRRLLAVLAIAITVPVQASGTLQAGQKQEAVEQVCNLPAIVGHNAAVMRQLGLSFVDFQLYAGGFMEEHKDMQQFQALFMRVGQVVYASKEPPIPELISIQFKLSCKLFPDVYFSMN